MHETQTQGRPLTVLTGWVGTQWRSWVAERPSVEARGTTPARARDALALVAAEVLPGVRLQDVA